MVPAPRQAKPLREDRAEPGGDVHGAHRCGGGQFLGHICYSAALDSAGDDPVIRAQVVHDVQREPVHRHASVDMDAQCSDLSIVDPDSSTMVAARGPQPDVGAHPDEHVFQHAHVCFGPATVCGEFENWVSYKLAWGVAGDEASSFCSMDGYAVFCQSIFINAMECFFDPSPHSVRQRMLQYDKGIVRPVGNARTVDGSLESQGFVVSSERQLKEVGWLSCHHNVHQCSG